MLPKEGWKTQKKIHFDLQHVDIKLHRKKLPSNWHSTTANWHTNLNNLCLLLYFNISYRIRIYIFFFFIFLHIDHKHTLLFQFNHCYPLLKFSYHHPIIYTHFIWHDPEKETTTPTKKSLGENVKNKKNLNIFFIINSTFKKIYVHCTYIHCETSIPKKKNFNIHSYI